MVNRSQADINNSISSVQARHKEREWFKSKAEYVDLINCCGTEVLAANLMRLARCGGSVDT